MKSLLLRPEQSQLEDLQTGLDAIAARVGTAEGLERATAEILVEAFRRAETEQHRALASAVAPVVVAAIRSEIANSKDMMVEALHPIAGRMVAAAVSSAFADLVRGLNAKIDALMSARSWRWRIRSLMTGRPVSEIALAEAHRPIVSKILVVERTTGLLLAYWDKDGDTGKKPDLISGMITAITDFSANVFNDRSGELRSLDFGSGHLFLHSSPSRIVAAEVTGPLALGDEAHLSETLEQLLERRDTEAAFGQENLGGLAQAVFLQAAEEKSGPLNLKPLFALLAVALAGAGYWGYREYARSQTEQAVRAAIASQASSDERLAAFPVSASFDHASKNLILKGLAPTGQAVANFQSAVRKAAPGYSVVPRLAVVATSGDIQSEAAKRLADIQAASATAAAASAAALRDFGDRDRQRAELIEKLTRSLAELRTQVADLASKDAQLDSSLADAAGNGKKALAGIGALETRMAAIASALSALQTNLESDKNRLRRVLRDSAIFFASDVSLRDVEAAAAKVKAIAAVLAQTGLPVRVVGYGDESGSERINREISLKRARIVADMLVERGVPRSRIVTAGRAAQMALVSGDGAVLASNRRVTFEPLFDQEAVRP
ncbi:MAG: OmpA family protein [Beijerinckiaceae bacterium]